MEFCLWIARVLSLPPRWRQQIEDSFLGTWKMKKILTDHSGVKWHSSRNLVR
jgi:hypothetical protein